MYKGYLQELRIGQVSNNLRQLALKIQSCELLTSLKCFPLGLCVSKLKLILLSNKSFTTSALKKTLHNIVSIGIIIRILLGTSSFVA